MPPSLVTSQIVAEWTLAADPDDKDEQTLLFRYPAAIETDLSPYLPASVKIEFGARSDHFPVQEATVRPYLSSAIPDALAEQSAHVRVLGAERTFWEKATILHVLHHLPTGKKLMPRVSRHYYDIFQLSNSDIVEQAIYRIDLLDRVATHKSIFFKSAWANYDTARCGTLRLLPSDQIVDELKRDYAVMEPMFFREPPPFTTILDRLRELEGQINRLA